jgi:hypothetical protein
MLNRTLDNSPPAVAVLVSQVEAVRVVVRGSGDDQVQAVADDQPGGEHGVVAGQLVIRVSSNTSTSTSTAC